MKSKVKGQLMIGVIGIIILLLWFFMGFIFPLFFDKTPSNNGEFGDGFGSINSLFSGLGFLALSYTLYLQIESSKNEKKFKQFELHFRLFSDLKDDLDNFEFNKVIGINAINELKKCIKQRDSRIEDGTYNHVFNYLQSTLGQFEYLLEEMKKYKNSSKYKNLLMHKMSLLLMSYLGTCIRNASEVEMTNQPYNSFKSNGQQLLDEIIILRTEEE